MIVVRSVWAVVLESWPAHGPAAGARDALI